MMRRKLSEQILKFVEKLPKFNNGFIAELQTIRQSQKKFTDDYYQIRRPPTDSNLFLRQLTIVIPFEFENFDLVYSSLKKKFPTNEQVKEVINNLKTNANSLSGSSWHRIESIARERGKYLITEIDSTLPVDVEHVHISYRRILPSFSIMILNFRLSPKISDRINYLQGIKYTEPIIFRKFWPINKIHYSYSSGGESGSHKAVSLEINNLKSNIINWVQTNFKLPSKILNNVSYIDVYELNNNPTDKIELKTWINTNMNWFKDFEIINMGVAYFNSNMIFSRNEPQENEVNKYVITKIDNISQLALGEFLEYHINHASIIIALNTLLKQYRTNIQSIKSSGFNNLKNIRSHRFIKPNDMYNLIKLDTYVKRFKSEFKENCNYIYQNISSEQYIPCILINNQLIDLAKSDINLIEYQINELKNFLDTSKSNLTEFLSVKNIYASYRLQNIMLIFTLITAIPILYSTEWSKIWSSLYNYMKHSLDFFMSIVGF